MPCERLGTPVEDRAQLVETAVFFSCFLEGFGDQTRVSGWHNKRFYPLSFLERGIGNGHLYNVCFGELKL